MTETKKPPQLPQDDIDPFEPITMLEEVQQYPINVSDNTIPEPTLGQTVIPNHIETTECVDWVVVSSQKAIGSVDDQEFYENILYPEPITVLLPKQMENGYIDVTFTQKIIYPDPITVLCPTEKPAEYVERIFYPEPIPVQYPTDRAEELGEQEPIRVLCHTGKPAEYVEKLFYPEPITIMCPTERAEELWEQELYEQVLYPEPITIICPMEKYTDLFRKPGQAGLKHPPYAEMIAGAIIGLNERSGSSLHAIIGYIVKNYDIQAARNKAAAYVLASLKKGVADGVFKRARESGKGAGKYRLVAAVKKKKELKAKKPVVKKSKKIGAKKNKKPAAKNIARKSPTKAAKRPRAKKLAKTDKKIAAKKMLLKRL